MPCHQAAATGGRSTLLAAQFAAMEAFSVSSAPQQAGKRARRSFLPEFADAANQALDRDISVSSKPVNQPLAPKRACIAAAATMPP